ncbi:MAG: hypothetical protein JNM56_38800 [Planctomycetia bacterium]|nr:hypothetical protein [Planctomycetia bacterium]
MPIAACPQCEQPVGEQELLCGHCGQALIPQLSRMDLQRLTEAERNRYFRPFVRGLSIGLVAGLVVVGLLIVSVGGINGVGLGARPKAGPGWLDLSLVGTIAILGGMVGLMRGLLAKPPKAPPHP